MTDNKLQRYEAGAPYERGVGNIGNFSQ